MSAEPAGAQPPRMLLRGRPGVGKTTVCERLVKRLTDAAVPVRGILTGERRERGRRVGFEVRALEREVTATLAHVDLPGPPRVGRYGVDLAAFERVALPALAADAGEAVVIIDELGPMELASEAFREAVEALVASPRPVVATVHARPHPFTDALPARADLRVAEVTPGSREELPGALAAELTAFWRTHQRQR